MSPAKLNRSSKATTAAAKAKAKAAKAAVAEQASTTTLDDKHATPVRRQLARRNTEQQVERALNGPHFKHLSQAAKTMKEVDGKTCRQALTDAFHAVEKNQRISCTVYTTIAKTFSENVVSVDALRPLVADLPLDETLVSTLEFVQEDNGGQKSLTAFQSFVGSCPILNQRNVIGMVRTIMTPRMLSRDRGTYFVLACMTYFAKFGVRENFPHIYKAVISIFDNTCVQLFAELKKEGLSLDSFLREYQDVLALVANGADLQAVRASGADLSKVKDPLCRLVNESNIGAAMLGDKLAELHAHMSSTQLDKLMLEMAALPKINQRVFDEYVLKCKAVLAQSGNDERNARDK